MLDLFSPDNVSVFLQVVAIDIVLAGDNAIVIGLAAAGLPKEQRAKVIMVGLIAATVLRIVFAGTVMQLMSIIGLMLAGGLLLLWVVWKMWRELREQAGCEAEVATVALAEGDASMVGCVQAQPSAMPTKTFRQAATQIIIADVSMSLDNVLAVAGAARDHMTVMILGLALSIALMGLAAGFVARILNRHRWVAYVGLVIIAYVAGAMIWEGSVQVIDVAQPAILGALR
jgi:YjbE family integral membrane protein